MKNIKKFFAVVLSVGIIATVSVAFAATSQKPADIAAELTGKSIEEVYEERAEGKTFGTIARDAGKLEEFKNKMLDIKKSILEQKVKDGVISQEDADKILNNLKENMENCDGSGSAMIGKVNGVGLGMGQGMRIGRNQGNKKGNGMRNNNGTGNGYRVGSCLRITQ